MPEQVPSVGLAILEVIDLCHGGRIGNHMAVVTICALFKGNPANPLDREQHKHLEEIRKVAQPQEAKQDVKA
jgi:hypothetical protein